MTFTIRKPFDLLPFSGLTLQVLIDNFQFNSVLDIGSGAGSHSKIFADHGKVVTALDYGTSIYYKKKENYTELIGDFNQIEFDNKFDCIWASHVLEHQLNVNQFLKKIHLILNEGGVLSITVPPPKHNIVGGHVSLWNIGLVIYHLVLAGFNCRNIHAYCYGYNQSIILKKQTITLPTNLSYDSGDIELLSEFFPVGAKQNFNGNIKKLNWSYS